MTSTVAIASAVTALVQLILSLLSSQGGCSKCTEVLAAWSQAVAELGDNTTSSITAASTDAISPTSIPQWVADAWVDERQDSIDQHNECVQDVEEANQAGKRLQLVLFGDSITHIVRDDHALSWDQVLADVFGLPLGMGGSTVEEAAWRLVYGGERPQPDPEVWVLLFGYNNIRWSKENPDPVPHMDWLLGWMRAAMPDSKLALMAVLPNQYIDAHQWHAANEGYRSIAEKHGALFIDACSDFDPIDRQLYQDGTHLAAGGQKLMLQRMKAALQQGGYLHL